MDEITGILSVKIARIGTLSEGPDYYIKFIDKKVEILGEIIETKSTITIDYEFVRELD